MLLLNAGPFIPSNMDQRWQQILNILRKTLNPGLFQVWIKPLKAECSDSSIQLSAPNEFVASWVRDRLLDSVAEAAANVMGRSVEIHIATTKSDNSVAAAGPAGVPVPVAKQLRLPASSVSDEAGKGAEFCWRFSFDDFVVGPGNRLAYAAAQSMCDNSLNSDQLFLSSSPGLGKTHLLHAVGRQLYTMSNKHKVRVEYLTGEEFVNSFHHALRTKSTGSFKARFRDSVDILLLEDVHFFQSKPKLQDELLATLKALQTKGAKVVFTSSFLPKELKDLDDQLGSRFCSGFLAVIGKPDFETRRQILKKKAAMFHVLLPDCVTDVLADGIRSDVRRLESCLQSLIIKAQLLNEHISLELAQQVVDEFGAAASNMNLDGIIDFICKSYELTEEQLGSKSRKRQIVIARNTAFYLARKHTEMSLKDIGDYFNRKHSTVLKGISNVEREIDMETPLGRQLARTVEMAERHRPRPNQ